MTDSQNNTALRLLEEQKDIQYIMQVTGLSEAEIRKLQASGNPNNADPDYKTYIKVKSYNSSRSFEKARYTAFA